MWWSSNCQVNNIHWSSNQAITLVQIKKLHVPYTLITALIGLKFKVCNLGINRWDHSDYENYYWYNCTIPKLYYFLYMLYTKCHHRNESVFISNKEPS